MNKDTGPECQMMLLSPPLLKAMKLDASALKYFRVSRDCLGAHRGITRRKRGRSTWASDYRFPSWNNYFSSEKKSFYRLGSIITTARQTNSSNNVHFSQHFFHSTSWEEEIKISNCYLTKKKKTLWLNWSIRLCGVCNDAILSSPQCRAVKKKVVHREGSILYFLLYIYIYIQLVILSIV